MREPYAKEKSIDIAMAAARIAYEVHLARGRSYISSTLSESSRTLAIAETLNEFRRMYGDGDLKLFQQLLAEDLKQRGKLAWAKAVNEFTFTTFKDSS